ncbi:SOLH2 protein, partial [Polypterus senegalus]|nr:uncharacterized protein LOC120524004 [Polypterus senegalus]MBN3290652.1 SOLH2 protein [Polypterus senegalus]
MNENPKKQVSFVGTKLVQKDSKFCEARSKCIKSNKPLSHAASSEHLISPSKEINCKVEALLHSVKEQRRRQQIKKNCDHLRALLPKINRTRIDTASLLEITVDYMRFIQENVPKEVLSQVAKLIQEYGEGRWWKPLESANKRIKPKSKMQNSTVQGTTASEQMHSPVADYWVPIVQQICNHPSSQGYPALQPSTPIVPSVAFPETSFYPSPVMLHGLSEYYSPKLFPFPRPYNPMQRYGNYGSISSGRNNSFSILQGQSHYMPPLALQPNPCVLPNSDVTSAGFFYNHPSLNAQDHQLRKNLPTSLPYNVRMSIDSYTTLPEEHKSMTMATTSKVLQYWN